MVGRQHYENRVPNGHINHDSIKLQHKKALKLAKVRPFDIRSGTHSSPDSARADVTCGLLRESRGIRTSASLNGTFIRPRMQC